MGEKERENREKLQFENELKRLKLSAEYGAQFHKSEEGNLSPEIENQWLKYIENFEKQYHDCKQVSVFQFLGKPEVLPVSKVPEENIEKELERLENLLHEKGIVLDTLCTVDARELYRFITEELFQHEIDDISIEGMTTNFIYEEFHPNDEYDIERTIDDFFLSLFGSFFDMMENNLSKQVTCGKTERMISRKKALTYLNNFKMAYEKLEQNILEIENIEIKDRKASVSFNISYSAFLEKNKQPLTYEGNTTFMLEKDELDYWVIYKFGFPGLEKS